MYKSETKNTVNMKTFNLWPSGPEVRSLYKSVTKNAVNIGFFNLCPTWAQVPSSVQYVPGGRTFITSGPMARSSMGVESLLPRLKKISYWKLWPSGPEYGPGQINFAQSKAIYGNGAPLGPHFSYLRYLHQLGDRVVDTVARHAEALFRK